MIGGFHVSGCLAMLKDMQTDIKVAQALGISIFAGEAEEGLDEVLQDAARGELRAALQSHEGAAGHRRRSLAALPSRRFRQAHRRQRDELRCRARLPLPMLVLHHHQRAGAQVALPLAGLDRADPAHELGARREALLHHRRQFRAQQGLGSDLRPDHQVARRGRHGRPLHDPGRYALPQDPELHREVAARRRHPRVHRAREHQSGEPDRRQEAPEQDHRVPQDAARVEARRHHDLRRLHPRLPQRHAGTRSATTSRSSRRSCRSTRSSSSC